MTDPMAKDEHIEVSRFLGSALLKRLLSLALIVVIIVGSPIKVTAAASWTPWLTATELLEAQFPQILPTKQEIEGVETSAYVSVANRYIEVRAKADPFRSGSAGARLKSLSVSFIPASKIIAKSVCFAPPRGFKYVLAADNLGVNLGWGDAGISFAGETPWINVSANVVKVTPSGSTTIGGVAVGVEQPSTVQAIKTTSSVGWSGLPVSLEIGGAQRIGWVAMTAGSVRCFTLKSVVVLEPLVKYQIALFVGIEAFVAAGAASVQLMWDSNTPDTSLSTLYFEPTKACGCGATYYPFR